MANIDGESVEVEAAVTKKYIVKCRSKRLISLMKDFNEVQKEAVRRIGFGGLLEMSVSNFEHDNVHHFVEKFNDRIYVFQVTEHKEFMISKHDVHDCFLLPLGPTEVMLLATGPKKDENEAEVRSEFGIKQPGEVLQKVLQFNDNKKVIAKKVADKRFLANFQAKRSRS